MPATYESITSQTITSGGINTFTFSNIPQTYTDLVLTLNGTQTTESGGKLIKFNGSSSGYDYLYVTGTGTNAGTNAGTTSSFIPNGLNTGTSNAWIKTEIFNYTNTNVHKAIISRSGSTNTISLVNGRWGNTNAITQIEAILESGFYSIGFTANLYGILRA